MTTRSLVHFEANPSPRSLRGFGFVALAVFGAAGYAAWSGGGAPARAAGIGLLVLGVVAGLCSLVRPRWNLPLYLGLSALSYPLAWMTAWLLLRLVFLAVVTPSALFYRAWVQRRGTEPPSGSAWCEVRATRDKDQYFRQF